jgi:flagellar basal body rod protein FlgG
MDVAATTALRGIEQAQNRVDTAARHIATAGAADAVDLSTEAVALIQARDDFGANIAVLKTADDLQKSLLSLFG